MSNLIQKQPPPSLVSASLSVSGVPAYWNACVPAAGLYTLSCRANSMNKGNVPGRAPRIKISTLRVQSRYRMSSLGTGGALCFAKVCSMSPADIRMLAFWNFIGKRDHPLQTEKENGTESWDSNPVYDHRPRRPWHMIPVPNLNIVRCMCRHVAHAPPPHPTPDLEKQKNTRLAYRKSHTDQDTPIHICF